MRRLVGIRASAGSGKTYALATRYLELLEAGCAPDSILATTFTRKAAGEILSRVLSRLAKDATTPDKQRRLAEFCRCLHRVSVCTIDAYFSRLARCLGGAIDLPVEPVLTDDQSAAAQELRREAIRRVLAGCHRDETLEELLTLLRLERRNQARRSIAQRLDTVLVRLGDLRRSAAPAAWKQLKDSIQGLMDADSLQSVLSNLPALQGLLGNELQKTAFRKELKQLEDGDWASFLKDGFAAKVIAGETSYQRKPLPEELIHEYQALIRHAQASQLYGIAEQTEALGELAQRFGEEYDRLRWEQGTLLFSDIPYALREWAAQADERELAYRLETRLENVLLDEFQDTSVEQWRLLEPCVDALSKSDDRSLFCVGDLKQAIYGWRGGTIAVFQEVERYVPSTDWESLDASYRSSEIVLGAVNRVFGNLNAYQPTVEGFAKASEVWQGRFQTHTHARTLPGYVELRTTPALPTDDDGTGDEETANPVKDFHLARSAETVEALAKAAPWASVGVLMRTRAGVSELLYLLQQAGLPVSGEGGSPLDDDPAVETILAALTLGDHPGHSAAAFQLQHSPLGSHLSLSNHETDAPRASARIRKLATYEGLSRMLADWAKVLAPHADERGARRLTQLVELAEAFVPRTPLRLSEFVRHARSSRVEEPTPARVRVMSLHASKGLEFDIVVLPDLTSSWLPSSLQLPLVLTDQPEPLQPAVAVSAWPKKSQHGLHDMFPRAYDAYCRREIEEGLCELYVAMTRARYALHMLVPPMREVDKGNSIAKRPSAAQLLRATLALDINEPSEGDACLFSEGDPHWNLQSWDGKPQLSADVPENGELRLPMLKASRSRRMVRPSDFSHGGKTPVSWLLSLEKPDNLRYGGAIHALLASVTWLDNAKLDDVSLSEALRRTELPSQGADGCIADFRRILAMECVRSCLDRSAHPDVADGDVWIERPCFLPIGDDVISGIFDRVHVHRDAVGKAVRAQLFDWKTDTPDEPGRADPEGTYGPQLRQYRRALSVLLNLPESAITLELVFVSDPPARVVVS